jgi:broad specificity phosphatase PhoE
MNGCEEVTQLILIRRGRTILNAAGRFRGHRRFWIAGQQE